MRAPGRRRRGPARSARRGLPRRAASARLLFPRPNGVAYEREPKTHRRASVAILTDGVSDSFSVLTFVGRSTSGRRRIEGASEAFSYARKTADDLLRRGVVPEVRISFAVERVEHRVEIRVRREDGSIMALPWHETPRQNPPPATPERAMRDLSIFADYKFRPHRITLEIFRGDADGAQLGGIDVADFGIWSEQDLEDPCRREFRALRRQAGLPGSTPMMFTNFPRIHGDLKRKGIGVWLYAEAARLAWLLRRAVICQDACRGSSTSLEAMRVWASSRLARYVEDAHEPGDVEEVDLGDGYDEPVRVDAPRVAVWRRRDDATTPTPAPAGVSIVTGYRENPSGITPPREVVQAFREGLLLDARGMGGKGLRPETRAEARRIARGEPVSREKMALMRGWFARHGASPGEVAARRRQAAALAAGRPLRRAPALVAWLLWGGDSGQRWVKSLR